MLAFASGQAAITGLLLAVLRAGDTVALPSDGYFTVRAFAEATLRELGVNTVLVPTAGPYPSFEGVRLVLLETPANPGLDVCDIRARVGRRARRRRPGRGGQHRRHPARAAAAGAGRRPDRGLRHQGADRALRRASGLRGAPTTPTCWPGSPRGARRPAAVPGAFDSWLAHRSIATLDLRLARQSANAAAVAELLSGRSDVEGVRWPGLPGDPSYPIATAQMRRIPGIVSFDLGSAERVARFLTASALVFAATSFGGVHTTADRRAQWGDDTSAGFVRLSCGIEDTADLLADLTAALDEA